MEHSEDLLSALVTQSFAELRESGDALLQHWQKRAARAETELELVRERILNLYRGNYMPTPAAVERALYPTTSLESRLMPESS